MNEMPSNQVFHVTYDIGCRLEPYFSTHHPNFHNRMVFMINAFHAYAHEMNVRCNLDQNIQKVVVRQMEKDQSDIGLHLPHLFQQDVCLVHHVDDRQYTMLDSLLLKNYGNRYLVF